MYYQKHCVELQRATTQQDGAMDGEPLGGGVSLTRPRVVCVCMYTTRAWLQGKKVLSLFAAVAVKDIP